MALAKSILAIGTALAAVGSALGAPGFTGATALDGTSSSVVNDVALLPDGSSLIAGRFREVATFGPQQLTSAGSWDGFVAKRRGDGSYAWVTAFGWSGSDSATSVAAAADGTVLVTGHKGGAGTEMFVAKLASTGGVQWTRFAVPSNPGSGSWSVGSTDVAEATDGGVLVTGSNEGGTTTFGPGPNAPTLTPGAGTVIAYIARLDASGTFTWATGLRGSGRVLSSALATLPDGTAIVGGTFRGTTTFGSPPLVNPTADSNNGFVARITPQGSVSSAQAVTSAVSSQVTAISAAPDGHALVLGFGGGTMAFGSDTTVVRTGTNDNAFAALQAPDGHFRWASASDPPGAASTFLLDGVLRADGSAVAAGATYGATRFGAHPATPRGAAAALVVGITAAGEFRWLEQGGPGGTGEAEALGVSALPDGTAQVVGWFDATAGSATFGPATIVGASGVTGYTSTVLDVPVTPAAPTARAGEERATVAVAGLGGSAVTGYDVQASPGGRTCVITPPSSECTISGLSAGTPHVFTAVATNAAGSSPRSAASAAVVPTAPTARTVARLKATTRCLNGRCTTTGALPSGATRVAQSATTGSRANALAQILARRSVTGTCRLSPAKVKGKKVKNRTYTCRIRLSKGTWTLTTDAFAGAQKLATSSRKVTVRR